MGKKNKDSSDSLQLIEEETDEDELKWNPFYKFSQLVELLWFLYI